MPSVAELILSRVLAALLTATDAGPRVARAREDAYGEDELPAINIRRAETSHDVLGASGDKVVVAFDLELTVRGAGYETAADALHMQAHAILNADAVLASKGRGLRCLSTSIETVSTDQPVARLTARYQMQVFVRPGDLATAIN